MRKKRKVFKERDVAKKERKSKNKGKTNRF